MNFFKSKPKNPEVVRFDDGYGIRFIRNNNWRILVWVQDLTGRKMKYNANRPVVIFNSKEGAEKEVKEFVIPYLLEEGKAKASEIVGWE